MGFSSPLASQFSRQKVKMFRIFVNIATYISTNIVGNCDIIVPNNAKIIAGPLYGLFGLLLPPRLPIFKIESQNVYNFFKYPHLHFNKHCRKLGYYCAK